MSDNKHTPAPWTRGKYDEHLGYDCMTGGIRVGPVVLDGSDYGQQNCKPICADALARMEADAHLIAAAPELLVALKELAAEAFLNMRGGKGHLIDNAYAAIAKARGK